ATSHLIELGHRRIGCIARPTDLSHSQERIRGYRAALRDHGLAADDSLMARGGFRIENGRQAALRLLDLDPAPTACFAYNDIMAIGALRAAHERGLRVPQDFSIVGFDDIEQAAYTCPALSTIAQPKFDMGRRGAELLLSLITDGSSAGGSDRGPPAGAEAPLPIRLVVRESSGPAPRRA
ncbi:MAG TPA: substrate-binding domain-containing protein, partial [Acidobacteriota bacterium]